MSLLVPVFTALQKRVASTLSRPKVRARALRVGQDVADDEGGARIDARWPGAWAAGAGASGRSRVAEAPAVGQRAVGVGSASSDTSALPSARL